MKPRSIALKDYEQIQYETARIIQDRQRKRKVAANYALAEMDISKRTDLTIPRAIVNSNRGNFNEN